jgi:hypothetical protein
MMGFFGILGAAILFAVFGYMTLHQGCDAKGCGDCAGDSCSLPGDHGGDANLETSSKASGWWS